MKCLDLVWNILDTKETNFVSLRADLLLILPEEGTGVGYQTPGTFYVYLRELLIVRHLQTTGVRAIR